MAATVIGLHDEELHVEDVAVRILPQPAESHGAAATFDLVRTRSGEEVARESPGRFFDALLVPVADPGRASRSQPDRGS